MQKTPMQAYGASSQHRQMDMRACPLGSLPVGIKEAGKGELYQLHFPAFFMTIGGHPKGNLYCLLFSIYAVIIVPVFPRYPSFAFPIEVITARLSGRPSTNSTEAWILGSIVLSPKCPASI